MNGFEIRCPECEHEFELTETLAAPLVAEQRKKARKYFDKLKSDMADRETALEKRETSLADTDAEVRRRVEEGKATILQQANDTARSQFALKLKKSEAALVEQAKKLEDAEVAELEARQLKREAEEAQRTTELTVQRRLDEEFKKIRIAAQKESDDEHRLLTAEKDKQMADMRKQIEDLRRKSNSGSQQLQGDVQEMDLAAVLENAFPGDSFARIKKGQSGGDVIQRVIGPGGVASGTILWEAKRTKTYSPSWLPKLRDDQGRVKADVAVLMSEVLPDDIEQFDRRERVWVCSPASVTPLAAVLRQGIIETSRIHQAMKSSDSRKDQVFQYLTGPEFRARVSGIVDAYSGMRDGLDTEKRSAHRQWSTREKQLERLLVNMAGMYGDLQGIAGASIQTVEGLEVPQLEVDSLRPKLVVNTDTQSADDPEASETGE